VQLPPQLRQAAGTLSASGRNTPKLKEEKK